MQAFLGGLLALSLTAVEPTPLSVAAQIEQLMYGEHRSADNIARNRYRHPVGTLSFFGISEEMDVLEIWPGGGWYMEILAPLLKDGPGSYTAAGYDPDVPDQPGYRYRQYDQMMSTWKAQPGLYGNARFVPFSPPESASLGDEASYDLVLTFRNMHGLVSAGEAEAVLDEFFRVLRPGGTLGVVQHRAEAGADPEDSARRGYLPQDALIAMAEAAGFRLIATSEVNANPRDSKDHPQGVWTLPPSLRLGEEDREKYLAIGESDRMTLKFEKPRS